MTAPDFDALIERLSMVRVAYALAAERDHDMQIGNSDVSMQSKMFADAAAALVQLREENARLTQIVDLARPPEGKVEIGAMVSQIAPKELIEQALHIVRAERDAAFALLRVCKDSVHPDTKIVIEALIT